MATQKGGLAGVGFNKKDLSNYIEHRMRSTIKDGDAMASLSYLPGKANNDQMFYAKYLISEDGKLMNLFWADVNSRIDYQYTLAEVI